MNVPATSRLRAVRRDDEARVTPLELFFDLVFVLAITQVTALMADDLSWSGLGKGLLTMALLWWVWVGYAWLTSVVDPEEGAVRFAMFMAMAALTVMALAVPGAFDRHDLLFAVAYGLVRATHIALFVLASGNDRQLRSSVWTLATSSGIGVALVVSGAFLDAQGQAIVWAIALAIDYGGPLLFAQEGWKIHPSHFAERHGLIMIIALGESIVAIGIAASSQNIGSAEVFTTVCGILIASGLWWLYFDVTAIAAEHRLATAPAGAIQNGIARDAYSFLHLPMVMGIVLVALGLKKTIGHVDEPLKEIAAVALFGGIALYLLGLVAFRLRNVKTWSVRRVVGAAACLAFIPLSAEVDAVWSAVTALALVWAVIAYEAIRYAEHRDALRHGHA